MISITRMHHIAILCSDYEKSKSFYTQVLGFEVINEVYRQERQSYKLDLSLNGQYLIELFSFPEPPSRLTQPEATGLRHIAFEVEDVQACYDHLKQLGVKIESVRVDQYTQKKFVFLFDPDNLPIELYQK